MKYFLFVMTVIGTLSFGMDLSFFPPEYVKEAIFNAEHDLKVEAEELKKEPFIIVSLGENCFPALHLREHGLRIRSFPFDWDITPFPALYSILYHNFEGFIDLKNLGIIEKENTVYNKRYQFKLNHDFEIVDWYDTPRGIIPRNMESMEKYEKVISYYSRRVARFYKIFELGIPIYLIRRVINPDQARALYTLLKTRFPQSDITLVCIEDEKWVPIHYWRNMPPGIIHYRVSTPISHKPGVYHPQVTALLCYLGLLPS